MCRQALVSRDTQKPLDSAFAATNSCSTSFLNSSTARPSGSRSRRRRRQLATTEPLIFAAQVARSLVGRTTADFACARGRFALVMGHSNLCFGLATVVRFGPFSSDKRALMRPLD